MGSEVAQYKTPTEVGHQNDRVIEGPSAKGQSNFDVDMRDAQSLRSVFSPQGDKGTTTSGLPEMSAPVVNGLTVNDVLSKDATKKSPLPDTAIVENGRVLADGRSQNRPPDAPRSDDFPFVPSLGQIDVPPLPELSGSGLAPTDQIPVAQLGPKTLEAAQVGKREGFAQVSDRLLGKGFDKTSRDALTNAMRDQWRSDPSHSSHLSKNDRLLTKENMDSVLGRIKDEGVRSKVREQLLGAEGRFDRPQQPQQRRGADGPDRWQAGAEPDRDGYKSPFLRHYDVGDKFNGQTSVYWEGRTTASGLPFNRYEMTAASKEFPFGTVLKVTNPENGREVRVVVTDHGPFAGKKVERPDGSGKTHSRVLDISLGAANQLGMSGVKGLDIQVESIPAEGKWGRDRRNIHGDYRKAVASDVRRLTNSRGLIS